MIKTAEIIIVKPITKLDEYGNQKFEEEKTIVPIILTSSKFGRFDVEDAQKYERTIGFKVERELMADIFIFENKQYRVLNSNEIDLAFDYVTAAELATEKELTNES